MRDKCERVRENIKALNEDQPPLSVSEEGGWAVIASLVVDLRLACRNAQRERERERGLKMEEKKGFNINQLWKLSWYKIFTLFFFIFFFREVSQLCPSCPH